MIRSALSHHQDIVLAHPYLLAAAQEEGQRAAAEAHRLGKLLEAAAPREQLLEALARLEQASAH